MTNETTPQDKGDLSNNKQSVSKKLSPTVDKTIIVGEQAGLFAFLAKFVPKFVTHNLSDFVSFLDNFLLVSLFTGGLKSLIDMYRTHKKDDDSITTKTVKQTTNLSVLGLSTLGLVIYFGALTVAAFALPVMFIAIFAVGLSREAYLQRQQEEDLTKKQCDLAKILETNNPPKEDDYVQKRKICKEAIEVEHLKETLSNSKSLLKARGFSSLGIVLLTLSATALLAFPPAAIAAGAIGAIIIFWSGLYQTWVKENEKSNQALKEKNKKIIEEMTDNEVNGRYTELLINNNKPKPSHLPQKGTNAYVYRTTSTANKLAHSAQTTPKGTLSAQTTPEDTRGLLDKSSSAYFCDIEFKEDKPDRFYPAKKSTISDYLSAKSKETDQDATKKEPTSKITQKK